MQYAILIGQCTIWRRSQRFCRTRFQILGLNINILIGWEHNGVSFSTQAQGNEDRPLTLLSISRKSTRNSLIRVHLPTNTHKCNISSCIMMCVFILVKSYSWQTLIHEQQCTQLRTGKRYTRKPCSENIQLRHRNCMYRFQDAYYKKLHIVNFKNISSIPCATTHTLQKIAIYLARGNVAPSPIDGETVLAIETHKNVKKQRHILHEENKKFHYAYEKYSEPCTSHKI